MYAIRSYYAWLDALGQWLGDELASHPNLVLAGDFNIAPDDRDVHDPAAWAGQVLCSEPERAAFRRFESLGLKDSFRLFEQPVITSYSIHYTKLYEGPTRLIQ